MGKTAYYLSRLFARSLNLQHAENMLLNKIPAVLSPRTFLLMNVLFVQIQIPFLHSSKRARFTIVPNDRD
jgi:hypothetical protein